MWNKGLKISGMSGKHQSKKHKEMLGIRNAENNPAKRPEVKEKMRLAKLGKVGANIGKHWKVKNTTNMGMHKEKHWNWKDGISENKHSTSEPKYKKWRSDVFTRDSWTCQTCGDRGCYLESHHIKSWSEHPELRYNIDNGVTLCKECHKLTDNYGGKKRNVQI